ncbi:MAG: hypothetical protein ABIP51_22190 [Bacteroidia bacterium]
MNTLSKIFGAMVLFGGGAYGISKLLKAGNTGKKLSVTLTSMNPPKIKSGALSLSVNVALDNPTAHTLTLKKPYLVASTNGSEVGNSIPSEEVINVPANQRTIIKGLNIQIPFTKLGSYALSLLTGKIPKMAFDVSLSTVADGIPYTDTQHFEV